MISLNDASYVPTQMLEKIFCAIEKQHTTAKECLIKSSVNTSFLSDWKTGKIKSPSFDKIYRISKTLGLSLDFLADDTKEIYPPPDQNDQDLTDEEKSLIAGFDQLNLQEKQIIFGKISEFLYNKKMEAGSEKRSSKVLWDLLADQSDKNSVTKKNNG